MIPKMRKRKRINPLFRKSSTKQSSFTESHRKLVYNTTRWQSYLYEMRGAATAKIEKDLVEPLREDTVLAKASKNDVKDFAHSIGRELFGRLYGNPSKLDDERRDAPEWVDLMHDTLDAMPEWEILQKQVRGDPDFSALASNAMMTSIKPKLAELIKQRQKENEESRDNENGESNGDGPLPGGVSSEDSMRSALRTACTKAVDDTEAGKGTLGGIAPGLDASPPADLQKETDRFDLIQALTLNPDFQEIARRAGRLHRISGRTTETRRSQDVYEEVIDVEPGSDITRLLPSEIMYLMDDDLEILELSRIVEGTALQYKLEGHEPQGRGPVIYIRDVSGSMTGDAHMWGAAVGVSLTSQTMKEKRTLRSACFNGGVHAGRLLDQTGLYNYDMERWESRGYGRNKYSEVSGSLSIQNKIVSGRIAGAKAALLHAKDGISGGTNFSPVMKWAMLAGLEEPRADFVFLTDGQAHIEKDILEKLETAKIGGLRIFGMTVNGGSVSPAVIEICDEVVDIDSIKNSKSVENSLGKILRKMR